MFRSQYYIYHRPDFLFFYPGKHCRAVDYILKIPSTATALLNPPHTLPSMYDNPPIFSLYAIHNLYSFSSDLSHLIDTFPLVRRLGITFAYAYFRHWDASEQAEAEPLFMPFQVFGLDTDST